ncbi:MAG: hypothetical protein JNJ90_13820 [Saprospiraceae bacterium]|jgi:hypothetical protein|nr:hypothetical protein [Saprospiraceae bacterium]
MPTHPAIPIWPARLMYAAALLAVVGFFQHKMAEEARLHRVLTAVAPLAVEAVDEGSGNLYRGISTEVNGYPNPYMVNHLRSAQAALREVRRCSKALDWLLSIPTSTERRLIFEQQIADMPALADSLWAYCDTDPDIKNEIHDALPTYLPPLRKQIVAHLSRADGEDADRWKDLLRLRYALASNTVLNYHRKRVSGGEGHSVGPFIEYRGLQTCPVAGDVFQADIFVGGYGYGHFPDYSVEINGAPCIFEAGKWTYRHRFDTPGVHQLNVETRMFDAWDSTLIQTCTRTFEVRVQPNHDLSTPKI